MFFRKKITCIFTDRFLKISIFTKINTFLEMYIFKKFCGEFWPFLGEFLPFLRKYIFWEFWLFLRKFHQVCENFDPFWDNFDQSSTIFWKFPAFLVEFQSFLGGHFSDTFGKFSPIFLELELFRRILHSTKMNLAIFIHFYMFLRFFGNFASFSIISEKGKMVNVFIVI